MAFKKGGSKMTLEKIILIAEKMSPEEREKFFAYLIKTIKRVAD